MNSEQVLESLKQRPLSYSSLKAFMRSPKHWVHYRTTYTAPTPAQIEGTALDIILLDGEEKYSEKFIVLPEPKEAAMKCKSLLTEKQVKEYTEEKDSFYQTKVGKEYKQKIQDEVSQKRGYVITKEFDERIKKMRDSVMSDHAARALIEYPGKTHKKIKWTHKETGLPFNGELDKMMGKRDFIMDLKKTKDAAPEPYLWDIKKLKYHLQGGMYVAGTGMFDKPFIHLAVENVEPFAVAIYEFPKDMISKGFEEYDKSCREFKRALDNDCFDQGYQFYALSTYLLLETPYWAR